LSAARSVGRNPDLLQLAAESRYVRIAARNSIGESPIVNLEAGPSIFRIRRGLQIRQRFRLAHAAPFRRYTNVSMLHLII
jgi:hypothetical protein